MADHLGRDAGAARGFTDMAGLRMSLMVHAIGGLLVLMMITTIAIYKPSGMTRYGVRKQHGRNGIGLKSEIEVIASMPRWVKVFGGVVIILALLLGLMLLHGGHGPGVFH